MASVVLTNVSKFYDATAAILDVDLHVAEGEFVVLLGPSGSGKTTLLRMIAGFISATTGSISIGGENVTSLPPRKRNIGMVFQDYALFPSMTVEDNIGFALKERKVESGLLRKTVNEFLSLIQLEAFGKRYPTELSGGQQQRVALARALAFSPRLLLMDEPLGALDLKLREAMRTEIHRIQRKLGITTILVTHDQEEAMTLADRIVVVGNGRIQQIGTPEQVYRHPANPFVAHFIGKVNLLNGQVRSVDGSGCVIEIASGVVVKAVNNEGLVPGQQVQISVRPEALHLVDENDHSFGVPFAVQIVERRFLGNLIQCVVSVEGGQELTLEHAGNRVSPHPGSTAWVGCESQQCIAFPVDSSRRKALVVA